jgi:hypothetical protein
MGAVMEILFFLTVMSHATAVSLLKPPYGGYRNENDARFKSSWHKPRKCYCSCDLRYTTQLYLIYGHVLCGTPAFIQHDRYTRTDTCVRWGMAVTYSRYKFVTVSLPKRFRNCRFTSETATWIQKWF